MASKSASIIVLLLTVLLSLGTLGMIAWLGVPALFQDEWTLVEFIERVRQGTANFRDFWVAFSEHRIFLPRVILAAVYKRGLDPRPLMWLSWLLIALLAWVAAERFFQTVSARQSQFRAAYLIAFLALIFGVVQYENWLWGLQIDFFMTQVFVLASSIVLSFGSFPFWSQLGLIALCAVGASSCSGQGMLLWISTAITSQLVLKTWRTRVLTLGALCIGLIFFVWQYKVDSLGQLNHASEFGWVLHEPGVFIRGVFALAGDPAVYWAGYRRLLIAPAVGAILFAGCVGQCIVAYKSRTLPRSAPFINLCLFGFLYCGLVALGRGHHGYNDWFLTSRYTTHALLIPVGMLGLSWEALRFSHILNRRLVQTLEVLPIVSAFLVFAGSWQATVWAYRESAAREFSFRLMPIIDRIDPSIDGEEAGPIYPLCPVNGSKVILWGIEPAIEKGLLEKKPVESVAPTTGDVMMRLETKPRGHDYLSHRIYAREFSGIVAVSSSNEPKALLVQTRGRFIVAAPLHRAGKTGDGMNAYQWRVLVPAQITLADLKGQLLFLYTWTGNDRYELSELSSQNGS